MPIDNDTSIQIIANFDKAMARINKLLALHNKLAEKNAKHHKTTVGNIKEVGKLDVEQAKAKEKSSDSGKEERFLAKKLKLRQLEGVEDKKQLNIFTQLQTRFNRFVKKYPAINNQLRRIGGAGVRGAGSMMGGMGSFVARQTMQIPAMLVGGVMGAIQGGYSNYLQRGVARFGLAGMGRPGDISQGRLGKQAGLGGSRLGYSSAETAQQARMVGRATGSISSVYRAQQFAMAGGGMDVGEAGGIMGQLTQGGIGFGGSFTGKGKSRRYQEKEGPKVLQKMIAGGMLQGLEKARLPEFLHGIGQITEMMGSRQTGRVGVEGITGRMAMLGAIPGMKGQRAMNLAQQLDQSIRTPGGGEAGQALTMQAFGFGKPGGQSTYYEATKRQQRGFFGEGGEKNLMDLMGEISKQYGGKEGNLVMSEMSGLTLDTVEGIRNVFDSSKSQEEKLAEIKKRLAEAGPIDQQALKVSKEGFVGVKAFLAGIFDSSASMVDKVAPKIMDLQKFQLEKIRDVVKWGEQYLPKIEEILTKLYDFIVAFIKKQFRFDIEADTERVKKEKGIPDKLKLTGKETELERDEKLAKQRLYL